MPIAAKLDEWGLPAWIALMILSFWVFWPLGLVVLAFLIGSRRMGCGVHHGMDRWQRKMERMQSKMDYARSCMEQAATDAAGRGANRRRAATMPSMNTAPRRCAAWRKSNANSTTSSSACASPRTAPSSSSSCPNAEVEAAPPVPAGLRRSRRAEPAPAKPSTHGKRPEPSAFTRGRLVSDWEAAAGPCRTPQ